MMRVCQHSRNNLPISTFSRHRSSVGVVFELNSIVSYEFLLPLIIVYSIFFCVDYFFPSFHFKSYLALVSIYYADVLWFLFIQRPVRYLVARGVILFLSQQNFLHQLLSFDEYMHNAIKFRKIYLARSHSIPPLLVDCVPLLAYWKTCTLFCRADI